ncbi:MAG: hypothetical protein HY959_08840 [Ignavibacteriae bacterium]|nr:hypothetical protein [Ignavibacteriota bacterium]
MEYKLTEKKLVVTLKNKLLNLNNNPFKGIWINKRLNRECIINEYKEEFGYKPVLQPEIDMIFRTPDNKLNAIEVKYLTKKNSAFSFSYYFGIGQALSLKRFGFDHVGLWLLVDENIPIKETNFYGSAAWSLIRNDLKLNLEYSYFKIYINKGKISFKVMQYKGDGHGFKLVNNIEDKKFGITWKYPNEIRCYDKPKFMRNLIEKYICI